MCLYCGCLLLRTRQSLRCYWTMTASLLSTKITWKRGKILVKSNQHIHLSVYVSFSSSSYSIFRLFLPLSFSFSLSLTHFIVVSCSIIFLYHFSISLSFCSLSLYFYRMYLSVMYCVYYFSLSPSFIRSFSLQRFIFFILSFLYPYQCLSK